VCLIVNDRGRPGAKKKIERERVRVALCPDPLTELALPARSLTPRLFLHLCETQPNDEVTRRSHALPSDQDDDDENDDEKK
jgi:hypothetical protein